jgi:fucose permease
LEQGVSVGTKLFPNSVKASALGQSGSSFLAGGKSDELTRPIAGLVFVMAQAGGSLFPSITGVIASSTGVQVLQPILVGLIVVMSITWVLVPKVSRRND